MKTQWRTIGARLGLVSLAVMSVAAAVWAQEGAAAAAAGGVSEGIVRVIEEHGLWLGLVAVLLGGLALNLTPCVYPMIPVTLAFFSGQTAGSAARTALLACCYVIGISISYAALGLTAANTGALLGSWLQHPAVLIGVAAVIVLLAFGMFGLYELRPPQALIARLGRASTGLVGALGMGLVVGVVAAPCIGPFVLGLLIFVGQVGQPAIGFLLFFTLGIGMGLPYLVLAVGAGRVSRLPKAGEWLVWVKQLLGWVLLALALYFLRPLMADGVWWIILATLVVGSGVHLGWRSARGPQGRGVVWARRLTGVALLAAAALLWPRPETGEGIAWVPYQEAAFEQALRDHRLIFVDVYADWCLPCIEMDHVTFRHLAVIERMQDIAAFRVDVTREVSEDAGRLLERYHVFGVPAGLLFDRTGKERTDLRLLGVVDPEEFLERLAKLES